MTDLSEYSDAEILAAAGGGDSPDLSSYSDADILSMAGEAGQPALFKQAVEKEGGAPIAAASGFLSGLSGLGDMVKSGLDFSPAGRIASLLGYEAPDIGGLMREGFDKATGVEDSTKLSDNSWSHTLGEYLPGTMLGGEKILEGGVKKSVGNIAKLLGMDAYLGTAGYLGHEIGGTPGEVATTLLAGAAPTAGKSIYKMLVDVPSEEQALLKAFKVPEGKVERVSPALDLAKDMGIITEPKSSTPFKDISGNLDEALLQNEDNVQGFMKGIPRFKVGDLMPTGSVDEIASGIEQSALSTVVKSETEGLIKTALKKIDPSIKTVSKLDEAYDSYLALKRAAKKNPESAERFLELEEQIRSAELSPNEVRNLRIKYDKNSKWNQQVPQEKAAAYRNLRDELQGRLLEGAGPNKDALAAEFDSYAKLLTARPTIKKLAGAEKKGATQAPGMIQQLLGNPIKSYVNKVSGFGHQPAVKPEAALKQAFGQSLTQKITKGLEATASDVLTSAVGGNLSAQGNSLLHSLQAETPSQQKTDIQSKSSFNSKLDNVVNQTVDKAMKVPEIIEAKRVSSKVLDGKFVENEEGGQRLKAYPPPAKGSGITVGTGVDLGQWSKEELKTAGVSDKTILKINKFLGLKDATARAKLKEAPLTLKKEEADELDNAVHSDIYGTVEAKLKDNGVNFNSLPKEAQTVIKSISLNFGKNFDDSLPSIWKAIVKKDWAQVQDLLRNTQWKQKELVARRHREADLLSSIA